MSTRRHVMDGRQAMRRTNSAVNSAGPGLALAAMALMAMAGCARVSTEHVEKSSDGAGRLIQELRGAACRAAARLPALRHVILFGSLVSGIPPPRSDADLLVVLSDRDHREPRDRVPEVRQALMPLPCLAGLFVLTS